MRRRNQRIKRQAQCSIHSVYVITLLVFIFAACMVYWSQDARCSALSQEIGRAEKEYKRLERDCQREAANWEELKTPDNLRQALIRHGLDMDQPNQEQVVHMNGGVPEAGQMSVARLKMRRSRGNVVLATPVRARGNPNGNRRVRTSRQ